VVGAELAEASAGLAKLAIWLSWLRVLGWLSWPRVLSARLAKAGTGLSWL